MLTREIDQVEEVADVMRVNRTATKLRTVFTDEMSQVEPVRKQKMLHAHTCAHPPALSPPSPNMSAYRSPFLFSNVAGRPLRLTVAGLCAKPHAVLWLWVCVVYLLIHSFKITNCDPHHGPTHEGNHPGILQNTVLVDTFRTYPYFEMRTQTGRLPVRALLASTSPPLCPAVSSGQTCPVSRPVPTYSQRCGPAISDSSCFRPWSQMQTAEVLPGGDWVNKTPWDGTATLTEVLRPHYVKTRNTGPTQKITGISGNVSGLLPD